MRRLVTISALFVLTLTAVASGQPPKLDLPKLESPKAPPVKLDPPKKADKPAPDPTDVAIARALANDPDVKMAQAKLQLAEAELAKARQTITLKVLTLKARLEQGKAELRAAELRYAHAEALSRAGTLPQPEMLAARDKLDAAKGAFAVLEAEWKLLTGAGNDTNVTHNAELAAIELAETRAREIMNERHFMLRQGAEKLVVPAISGPIPDRLRAALDMPVKLVDKGAEISFQQAMDLIKDATGVNVSVRGTHAVPSIVSQGEELPVGAWLQLFQDTSGGVFYVREYGLLIADKKAAPPDAPTLTEFWKQKPPAAKPEPKPAPEPKRK